MSFWGIALDPEYFTRPRDFCPERFLPTPPAEFAADNHVAFHPFSMGAFNCLGQNLANAESRLIMTKLLWHYDIRLSEGNRTDWPDQKSWGVFVKWPLYVELSRRG